MRFRNRSLFYLTTSLLLSSVPGFLNFSSANSDRDSDGSVEEVFHSCLLAPPSEGSVKSSEGSVQSFVTASEGRDSTSAASVKSAASTAGSSKKAEGENPSGGESATE